MPAAKSKPLILYSGPFRIELQQVSLSRDFQAGTAARRPRTPGSLGAGRLRPMLLKLKADEMKIVDEPQEGRYEAAGRRGVKRR